MDTKDLYSFAEFHGKNGDIEPGTKCFLKRNFESPLIEAEIVNYHLTDSKISFINKYMEQDSYATVSYNDKIEIWPLSMIYFEK